MSEFFVIATDMVRAPSGLLLPNRKGEALAVVGTLATQQLAPALKASGAEMAPYQAVVIVDINLFLAAAKDMARDRRPAP